MYFLEFLAHELEKLRAAFNAKQNELAEAVKKVDVLTHELEQRKNSENHPALPTPERINRRKKIQNAKDELFRLQNELIVSGHLIYLKNFWKKKEGSRLANT